MNAGPSIPRPARWNASPRMRSHRFWCESFKSGAGPILANVFWFVAIRRACSWNPFPQPHLNPLRRSADAMEFQTEAQKKVYEKVGQIMRDEFGKTAQVRDDAPSFVLRHGSAYVQVTIIPINEQYT